jgi:hypothetical protein
MVGGSIHRWAFSLATAALCSTVWGATASAKPKLKLNLRRVHGSTLCLANGQLMVGTPEGGVITFDARTQQALSEVQGAQRTPVVDIVRLDGQLYWANQDSAVLNVPGGTVDLASHGLGSPIRRLSLWQGRIVAHGDARVRFVEPASLRVLAPSEVLPADVATAVEQGPVATWSEGASGLLVSVRRYGRRDRPEVEGGLRDIAMLTAWSIAGDGQYRLLGSYCTSLFEFRDANGPRVRFRVGDRQIDNPYGTTDLGNLKLGPEGVVALAKDASLVIPFSRTDWMPNPIKMAVEPAYAAQAAYFGSSVWWAEGDCLVQGSLEDGGADVYHPVGRQGRILEVEADADGAYALTDSGVVRVRPTEPVPAEGFVRVKVGDEAVPQTLSGRRLTTALEKIAQLTPSQLQRVATPSGLHRYLKSQKVRVRSNALRDNLGELRYGDLLQSEDATGVYLGRDQILAIRADGTRTEPLKIDERTRLLRIVDPYGAIAADQFRTGRRELLTGLVPIGVGKPNAALGHEMFFSWDPNSPEDQPITPLQQQLAGMLDEWIGVPYHWGGSTLDGTDCSGLVNSLYAQLGIALPRHSQDIARAPIGEVVYDQLRFGDVLVFPRPKHCAIYVGGGRIIEAISGGVQYSTLRRFDRAIVRRFILDTATR